jgi:hypothetical protein
LAKHLAIPGTSGEAGFGKSLFGKDLFLAYQRFLFGISELKSRWQGLVFGIANLAADSQHRENFHRPTM